MECAKTKIRENRLLFLKDPPETKETTQGEEIAEIQEETTEIPEGGGRYEAEFFEQYNEKKYEWKRIAENEIKNPRYKQKITGYLAQVDELLKMAVETSQEEFKAQKFTDDFYKLEYRITSQFLLEQENNLRNVQQEYLTTKTNFERNLNEKRNDLLPFALSKIAKNLPENVMKNIRFRIKQETKDLGKIFLIELNDFEEATKRVGRNRDLEKMKEVEAEYKRLAGEIDNYFNTADYNEVLTNLSEYIDSINFIYRLNNNFDGIVQLILQNAPGQGKNVESTKKILSSILKKRIMPTVLPKGSAEDLIGHKKNIEQRLIIAYIADRTGFTMGEITTLINHENADYDSKKMEGQTLELIKAIKNDAHLKRFNIKIEGEVDAVGAKRITESMHKMVVFINSNPKFKNIPEIRKIFEEYPEEMSKIGEEEYQKHKKEIQKSASFTDYNGLGNRLMALQKAFKAIDFDFNESDLSEEKINALYELLASEGVEFIGRTQKNPKKRGEKSKGQRIIFSSTTIPSVEIDFNVAKFRPRKILQGIINQLPAQVAGTGGYNSSDIVSYLSKKQINKERPPTEEEILSVLSNISDTEIDKLPEEVVIYVLKNHERFPDIKNKIYESYIKRKNIEKANSTYVKAYERINTHKTPTKGNMEIRTRYEKANGATNILNLDMAWLDDYPDKKKEEYIDIWIKNYEFGDLKRENFLESFTANLFKSSILKNEEDLKNAKEKLKILTKSKNPKAIIIEGVLKKAINEYTKTNESTSNERIKNLYTYITDPKTLAKDKIITIKSFLPPDGIYKNENPTNFSMENFKKELYLQLAYAYFEEEEFELLSYGEIGKGIMRILDSQRGRGEYIYKFARTYNFLKEQGFKIDEKQIDYLVNRSEKNDLEKLNQLGEKLRYESEIQSNKQMGEYLLKLIKT